MKLILTGYMGSGKTAVGRHLSHLTGSDFLDLDQVISRKTGLSIPEIFEKKGEIFFRRLEAETLAGLLTQEGSFILALGGGTPCYGKNLELITNTPDAYLVYLKASLKVLTSRLMAEKESRPVISHLASEELLEDFIRKHLFERSFYYAQSNYTVNTDSLSPEGVAENIVATLN